LQKQANKWNQPHQLMHCQKLLPLPRAALRNPQQRLLRAMRRQLKVMRPLRRQQMLPVLQMPVAELLRTLLLRAVRLSRNSVVRRGEGAMMRKRMNRNLHAALEGTLIDRRTHEVHGGKITESPRDGRVEETPETEVTEVTEAIEETEVAIAQILMKINPGREETVTEKNLWILLDLGGAMPTMTEIRKAIESLGKDEEVIRGKGTASHGRHERGGSHAQRPLQKMPVLRASVEAQAP